MFATAPIVWSRVNLASRLRLLGRVVGKGFSLICFSEGPAGTLDGNMSSRKFCQRMLGGLLIMLKMANLRMGEKLMAKGVCNDRVRTLLPCYVGEVFYSHFLCMK